MLAQFDHSVLPSFYQWFDHTLVTDNQAYINTSGELYSINNPRQSNLEAYASPYAQWVYDSAATGAYIPTGVYVNGNFNPRSTNDLNIDYLNGRVYFDSPQANVTAAYARKEINTYITNENDVEVFFEKKYTPDGEYPVKKQGKPYDKNIFPAVYIKYYMSDNQPWALGGFNETTLKFRAICLLANDYQQDGVISIFRDKKECYVPLLDLNELPFNQYGDLKSGTYNYNTAVSGKTSRLYIKDVIPQKLSDLVSHEIHRDVRACTIDFSCCIGRYPRL